MSTTTGCAAWSRARSPATLSRSGSPRQTGGKRSAPFTYTAARREHATACSCSPPRTTAGPTPAQDPSGPHYADEYLAAVTANGVGADLYDVDARGRRAPHPLGVLAALRRRDLGHGRRLPDPRARPGPGDRHVAARARRAARGARLPQRGRQAGLRRQARRPAVRRGLRVPQLRVPAAQRGPAGPLVRRRPAGVARRLHRPHERLPPVLPGGLHPWRTTATRGTADGTVFPITGEDPFAPGTSWTFANQAGDPGRRCADGDLRR